MQRLHKLVSIDSKLHTARTIASDMHYAICVCLFIPVKLPFYQSTCHHVGPTGQSKAGGYFTGNVTCFGICAASGIISVQQRGYLRHSFCDSSQV